MKGLRAGNDFLRTYPYVHKLAVYWYPMLIFFLIFLFSCVVKLNFFSCGIYFISLEGPQLSWDVDIKIHNLKRICWWLWIYENHICELWFYEMNMKAISAVQCSIKFSKNQQSNQPPPPSGLLADSRVLHQYHRGHRFLILCRPYFPHCLSIDHYYEDGFHIHECVVWSLECFLFWLVYFKN